MGPEEPTHPSREVVASWPLGGRMRRGQNRRVGPCSLSTALSRPTHRCYVVLIHGHRRRASSNATVHPKIQRERSEPILRLIPPVYLLEIRKKRILLCQQAGGSVGVVYCIVINCIVVACIANSDSLPRPLETAYINTLSFSSVQAGLRMSSRLFHPGVAGSCLVSKGLSNTAELYPVHRQRNLGPALAVEIGAPNPVCSPICLVQKALASLRDLMAGPWGLHVEGTRVQVLHESPGEQSLEPNQPEPAGIGGSALFFMVHVQPLGVGEIVML